MRYTPGPYHVVEHGAVQHVAGRIGKNRVASGRVPKAPPSEEQTEPRSDDAPNVQRVHLYFDYGCSDALSQHTPAWRK